MNEYAESQGNNTFNPALLFDKSCDAGVVIELKAGGRISYQDVRGDFSNGDLLIGSFQKKWKVK